MDSPSTTTNHPLEILVVDDPKLLEAVTKLHPQMPMKGHAQWALLVCGDTRDEAHPGRWVQTCSTATQNLLVAAHALGLSAIWQEVYPHEEKLLSLKQLFQVPKGVIPFALIPVGHGTEGEPTSVRRDPSGVRRNSF